MADVYVAGYSPYVGTKAKNYELKRKSASKWKAEQRIVESLLSKGAGMVLDIPVGTGRFSRVCMERGRDLIGMDVSEDMMEIARLKGIVCKHANVLNIPLADKAVETVVCLRLLNWLQANAVEGALNELRRVAHEVIVGMRGYSLDGERHSVTDDYAIYKL